MARINRATPELTDQETGSGQTSIGPLTLDSVVQIPSVGRGYVAMFDNQGGRERVIIGTCEGMTEFAVPVQVAREWQVAAVYDDAPVIDAADLPNVDMEGQDP